MSAIVVATKFTAKDGYSSVVKKMQRTTGTYVQKAKAGFMQLRRNVSMLNRDLKGVNATLNKGFRIAAIGVGAGIAVATGLVTKFVQEASKIEDATAAFTPLLGSVGKAEKLVSRLNQEASTTPFQFENIAAVAQQLLPVMNGNIEDTANTFRMLGDTAGGNIQKLESITRGYTKALLKGKPDMEALNMIAEAGVPIFSEMATSMGITKSQLFDMSKQGKLTTNDLTKTFQKMTSEGGLFFNGMGIASATFSGKISTMKDNISLAFAEIGMVMLPILKEYTDKIIEISKQAREWISNNKELIKVKVSEYINNIATFLGKMYEIAKKTFNFISENYETIILLSKAILIAIVSVKIFTTVMAILNAVMSANPVGAIVIGVMALIVIIASLILKFNETRDVINGFFDSLGVFKLLLLPLETMWELIKGIVGIFKAFKADGFVAGMKQIGKTILRFILMPLEAVLSALAAVGVAEGAYENVKAFRASLDYVEADAPAAVNTQATTEQVRTERTEFSQRSYLTIKDQTGRAEFDEMPKGNYIQLTNTSGNF